MKSSIRLLVACFVVTQAAAACSSASHGAVSSSTLIPRSVSAVGDQLVWVLASRRCPAAACPASLVRSHDGGRTWREVRLPALKAGGGTGVEAVRFADASNGWLAGPALWATHDGGRTWHRIRMRRTVLALATGAGLVWVLTATCARGRCASYSLLRSSVTDDGFGVLPLPAALVGRGAESTAVVAAPSPDAVVIFASARRIQRTPDAGRHWEYARLPGISFSGQWAVAAFPDTTNGFAVLTGRDAGVVLRTSDGGSSWSVLRL